MADDPDRAQVTQLLHQWRDGDAGAGEDLIGLLHGKLRELARRQLQGEHPDHTLQATALVNEAYIRLVGAQVSWTDRTHFIAVVARIMRRVLVDHARAKRRVKRGGGVELLRLEEAVAVHADGAPDILELNDALERLAVLDERKARIVELHYFGGLKGAELAEVVEVSTATVERDLRFAKAWLRDALA